MKNRFHLTILCCVLSLFVVTGCASDKDKDPENVAKLTQASQEPVEKLYNKAARLLDKGQYVDAAKAFDDVEREYPYSQWATRAQLMSGFSYYKRLRYDEAVLALDRFIELHPGDDNVVYAWYLKALCFYEQISDVRRDQKMTSLALRSLQQVILRFPESQYARDAGLKIDLTRDHLAGKEMEIGRYYLERKQYQASINRFQRVVEQYQTTTQVPEALHRMVEAYLSLGIVEEARKTAAILGHNYPHDQWYKDTYRIMGGDIIEEPPEEEKSFLGKIFN